MSGPPPIVQTAEAETIANAMYGIVARAHALEGERDRNFLLESDAGCLPDRFVLKFIDLTADAAIIECQTAALAHLAETAADFPVPRVIPTRAGEPLGVTEIRGVTWRVRLVSYLPGRLALSVRADVKLLRNIGARLAQLDHALRGFFHSALGQPIAWDVRRARELMPALDLVPPAIRSLVHSALVPLTQRLSDLRGLRSQAIHGDCHPRNLLVDESAQICVGIFDFGDMIHAPLIFEPAVAMAEFLTENCATLDGVAELLTGYVAVQPLTGADVDVLYDLVAARIAVAVLIQARRTEHQPDAAQVINVAQATNTINELAVAALDKLVTRGREALSSLWHEAAGTVSSVAPSGPALLERRHRALGRFAELSYERPLHLVRGEGVWVYTAQGERLLDVYNNVPHVGHAHPQVVAAIHQQMKRIASNTRYLDEAIVQYALRLNSTLAVSLDTCLFVNSGSEANDIAWRIAKAHTGRAGALVMTHAYHGITDAVTGLSPAINVKTPPHVETLELGLAIRGSSETARGDVTAALARLRSRGFEPAAFFIDSALTSSGIYDPPKSWSREVAAAVRAAGALIIGDEVQYGLGRSGSDFWGFERRGYLPDIVTLGKPVGNGYPMGVVVGSRALLEKFQKDTGFFSTFGGNPVAAVAGLAVLRVLDKERLMENSATTGAYFRDRLVELKSQYEVIREVRGAGLMIGVEIAGAMPAVLTKRLVNGLREHGVLIGSEGPGANVLKMRPPLPFRPAHADLVIAALHSVLPNLDPGRAVSP